MRYKILMIDDDLKNIKATKGFLEINGMDVTTVQSPQEALRLVKNDEFALALVDYQMPETTGDMLAKMLKEVNPLQQIVVYSCDPSREALKKSYGAGAVDFIEKSESPAEILNKVRAYCHRYDELIRTVRPNRNKNENRRLLEQLGMIGQSEVMAEVGRKVQKLARAEGLSVLIHGESGTGKELVAKALHDLSPRARFPFVAINCAAIPKDLLESTLFGHKKGSFTGAVGDQDGKFVLAHGGTIFLDEIADMSLDLQSKLLRVLQERTVEPLGSRSSRKIDVRIVCASHKNIEDQVRAGQFREDLMYRIHVASVELPALRDRSEDIELLVGHFTDMFNKKYGFTKHFQHRALDVLKKYLWPGNIRELASVIENHLVQVDGPIIRPDDLDLKLFAIPEGMSFTTTLAELEDRQCKTKIEHILKTIEQAGSKVEAARRLGIKPPHLQYLLNESKAAKQVDTKKSEKAGGG